MKLERRIREEYKRTMDKGKDFPALKESFPLIATIERKERNFLIPQRAMAVFAIAILVSTTALGSYFLVEQSRSVSGPFLGSEAIPLRMANKEDISRASLEHLLPHLEERKGNAVVSPACQALVNGLVINESQDVDSFARLSGFDTKTAKEDTLSLLKGLNWSEEGKEGIRIGLLQQLLDKDCGINGKEALACLDNAFYFENAAEEKCLEEAENLFEEEMGISDLAFLESGDRDQPLLTYGALSLKDSYRQDSTCLKDDFTTPEGDKETPFLYIDKTVDYCQTADFVGIRTRLERTDLLFLLPTDEEDFCTFDILSAIETFHENKEKRKLTAKIPCFFIRTKICDKRETANGDGPFLDAIDENGKGYDSFVSFQTASFQIGKDGIDGGKAQPLPFQAEKGTFDKEVDFACDRPFFCLCLYEDFPLLLSKVVDPTLPA